MSKYITLPKSRSDHIRKYDRRFGWSIDITAEGNIIVLGAPGYSNNTDRPGYIGVFSLVSNDEAGDDTWNQIGQVIIGEANGDEFGFSVSISEDGKIIAVIVINSAKYNLGYVRIYCLDDDGTSWEQIGKDIDGEAAVDNFGLSVSLSANRSTIAIGAPYNNDNIDASFQFQVVVYKIDTVKGQAGNCWSRHPRRQCRR